MKRFVPIVVVALAVLLYSSPSGAHEEINPATFPTGKPTFFTLNAANEKKVDLTKITLEAPANLPFGESTRAPAGWTVDRAEEKITWSGGSVKPEGFDQWGFEIEGADQPGALTYKVTLGFRDSTSEDVSVVVNAAAPGSVGTSVTTTPGQSSAAGTTTKNSARGRANIALVLGVVALVLAAAALALALARRRVSAAGAHAETKSGATEAHDW